jgi:hypothetical protein
LEQDPQAPQAGVGSALTLSCFARIAEGRPALWHERLLFLLFTALAAGLLLLFSLSGRSAETGDDLETYIAASERLSAGESPYRILRLAKPGHDRELAYFYPPLLALLVRPLVGLAFPQRLVVWNLCSFAALLAAAAFLAAALRHTRLGRWHFSWRFMMAAGAAICFSPVWSGFHVGQVHAFVLCLLCAFVWADLEGYAAAAGTVLACAAWIKISPLLLLLVPLRHRQWRAVGYFTLAAAGIGAGVCLAGVPAYVFADFAAQLPRLTQWEYLAAGPFNYAAAPAFGVGAYGRAMLQLVIAALLGCALLAPGGGDWERRLAQHGAAVCAMIALSPIIWTHHLSWWLIPFFALCARAPQGASLGRGLACLAAYLLVCGFDPGYTSLVRQEAAAAKVLHAFPWALMAVSLALLAIISRRTRKGGLAPPPQGSGMDSPLNTKDYD